MYIYILYIYIYVQLKWPSVGSSNFCCLYRCDALASHHGGSLTGIDATLQFFFFVLNKSCTTRFLGFMAIHDSNFIVLYIVRLCYTISLNSLGEYRVGNQFDGFADL